MKQITRKLRLLFFYTAFLNFTILENTSTFKMSSCISSVHSYMLSAFAALFREGSGSISYTTLSATSTSMLLCVLQLREPAFTPALHAGCKVLIAGGLQGWPL